MSDLQFAQTVQAEQEIKVTGSPYEPSLADDVWEMMVQMNRSFAEQFHGETYDQATQ